ncbi:FR47-like family protein [Clostridium argentinense CDC 2741]|uniref:FR47-like family protein n=1 Tax=Clostridium argentinense CDC 2741 TaxID=1418104 RepID=A0A0C1QW84_9CLOT|nr:GNAT family N-acetyltransferase [Clostridium argentinense]ARC84269.1 GNAT family N-acetyltransferase [Clostridium argentinense]KIE45262.1 FR47-like family protein [Clostridium argentinense CDC 2741]NFF38228.1 GNAT family N-acetyltransferase [Clostridium argentinense]NFP49187.1 GNAT family N-acetyltransferase [Clostridium argentinense]NFP71533.1 GNAT family N-acetyltransferase [Clostridium argentinense]
MKIYRCTSLDIELVIEAMSKVKSEEDSVEILNETAINKFLTNENNYFLVAMENQQVLGYAIGYCQNRLDMTGDMMCLYEIGVLKEFRRQGVGKTLINALIEICHNINAIEMWVPTNKHNVSACTLYEKTGGITSVLKDEIIYTYKF